MTKIKASVNKSTGHLNTIEFAKPNDKNHVSIFSHKLLDILRSEAGLRCLIVTSAIRTAEEQAGAMYMNEVDRQRHSDNATRIQSHAVREAQDSLPAMVQVLDALNRKTLSTQQVGAIRSQTGTLRSYVEERRLETKSTVNYAHEVGKTAKQMATTDVRKPRSAQDKAVTVAAMTAYMKKGGLVNVTNHAGKLGLEVVDVSYKAMTPMQREKFKKAVFTRFGSSVYRFGYPDAPEAKYTFPDTVFHIEITQPDVGSERQNRVNRTA